MTSSRTIASTLAMLRPEDLFPAWRYVDLLEEMGELGPEEARRWKDGIYGLMALWELAPDQAISLAGGEATAAIPQATAEPSLLPFDFSVPS